MKKRNTSALNIVLILFYFFSSCSEDKTKVEPPEVVEIPLSDWSQEILLHESKIEYTELLEENSFAELNNTSREFNFLIFLKEEIASRLSSNRFILKGNVSELNSFYNELIFLLDYQFQKESTIPLKLSQIENGSGYSKKDDPEKPKGHPAPLA